MTGQLVEYFELWEEMGSISGLVKPDTIHDSMFVHLYKPGTLRLSNHSNAEHFLGSVCKPFAKLGLLNGWVAWP